MSEEEIIQWLIDEIKLQKELLKQNEVGYIKEDEEKRLQALQGMLELYNKQKEEVINIKSKYDKIEYRYKRLKNDYKFTHEWQRKNMVDKGRLLKEIDDIQWKGEEKYKYAVEVLEKLVIEEK